MIADAEGRELRTGEGARVVLGTLIKSGGAGSVYRVPASPLLVAKLYHPTLDLTQYERKVAAMLALTPDLPELGEGATRYVQIAWPTALLRDLRGRFVGYLMPAVDVASTSELECVMQEKQARALGLPTGLGAKVTLAANLANVIAELHRQQHRVVDLKPVNLRFYPKSLYMAMLDCDGFSIQGKGERFEAPQVTADYLAPEFQRGGLDATGEQAQDRFALAVIVFQLLNFGIHPFTGRPANDRVPTDVPSRIAARLYAYGIRPNAQLAPNPVSGHAAMPSDLRALFDRAFEGSGNARPSPVEWGAALRPYAQRASLKLVKCDNDDEHQHFAGLPCAACARAALISKARKGAPLAAAVAAIASAAGLRRPAYTARPPAQMPGQPLRTGFGRTPLRPPVFYGASPATAAQNQPTAGNPSPVFPPLQLPASVKRSPNWLLIWVVIFMLGYLAQFIERTHRAISSAAVAPVAPGYVAPEPPPPPPAAPRRAATLGAPPTYDDNGLTREAIDAVIRGAANDDRELVERSMSTLQRQQRTQALPDEAQRRESARRFASFWAQAPFSAAAIDAGRHGSYARMQDKPYDAEAVCEWSWLVLFSGNRDDARTGFQRAIWSDPQFACGWLGLSAIGEDAPSTFGAAIMAETLHFPDEDLALRDRLVESAFPANSDELHRWQIIDARARQRVSELRGDALPAQIAQRAGQMLPRRR